MKKILLTALLCFALTSIYAQKRKKGSTSNFKTELIAHYKEYYKGMLKNKDYLSAIQGLNHLIILEPENTARKDTLGLLYFTVDNPALALNALQDSESEIGLRTKALSFKTAT